MDTKGGDGDDETTGTSGITSATSSPTGADSISSTSADDAPGETTAAASDGTDAGDGTDADGTDADGSTGIDPTGNEPGEPIDCGNNVWQCGDGMDNDGDGFFDLVDPECTGPCDNDEGTFQTGIPGDNVDCKQDCFFDGNSGQGDDGCIWDLTCDPANPGANVGCEYGTQGNCQADPPNQSEDCIMFCEQYVPPGCDCFGCCTVQGPDGPIDIFLNSGPDCSFDNLAGCEECTSQIEECGNPCVPEDCEICFGETEPPKGCGENTCTSDLPCTQTSDCPTDYFCYLDCCYPPPPG